MENNDNFILAVGLAIALSYLLVIRLLGPQINEQKTSSISYAE
jgi:hypothetical protein